jgi:hypothetical protein
VARRNIAATHYAHRRADDHKQGLHYKHLSAGRARKCLNRRHRRCRSGSKPGANPRRRANKDDEPHNVVSDTGLFRSGAVDTDETFSFKFDKPGTYHFTCSIHPRMVETIIVE